MKKKQKQLKDLFLLDPNITFLNHGSFGACPKPIFDSLVKWQKLLEREPVKFLAFDLFKYLENSRNSLSSYLNCHKDDVVFFPNPSTALNTVIKSLELNAGDEILSTNHEYGALDRTWNFISKKKGIKYINQYISLPLKSKDQFIEDFTKGINDKTKVIFISHITSPTALIFPVKEICDIASKKNIITIVDGAHAPAHIDVNLKEIGADFYTGACHKWMCSPKGVAFLYAKKSVQHIIDPLVVSWGYEAENPSHSQYLDYLQWQGTNDMSPYLTIPDTIKFLHENNWIQIAKESRELNIWARDQIVNQLGLELIADENFIGQMSSIPFDFKDQINDQLEFYNRYGIQIPFFMWNNVPLIRLSIQVYNDEKDIHRLILAMKDFMNRKRI